MEPLKQTRYLLSETDCSRVGPCEAEVSLVGRSNVGKSSFLNALCNRKSLAAVSDKPGKTRTINVYEMGAGRWIVDLPGYGFSSVSKKERLAWKPLIEGYLTSRPHLVRVFVIIDALVGPTSLDIQMVDWLFGKKIPYNILANKTDKLNQSQLHTQRQKTAQAFGLKAEDISWISTVKETGLPALRDAVSDMLGL